MTYKECIQALGISQGIGFKMQGRREVPQKLYEFGYIEYNRSTIFSHTKPEDVIVYELVVFDKRPLKGKSFEFT